MSGEYDRSQVYDFISERMPSQVVGTYSIVEGPPLRRLLNLLFFVGTMGVYGYLAILAMLTVYFHPNEIAIDTFLFVWLLIIVLGYIIARHTSEGSLRSAVTLLKSGLYTYSQPDPELDALVARRVKQIRRVVSSFDSFCYLGAVINSWFLPFLTYLKLDPTTTDISAFPINPYLPIPLALPFSTHSLPSYLIAFVLESLFLFQTFVVYSCHLEVFMSTTLQLCAHLEALNHSIADIERRARSSIPAYLQDSEMYQRPEFQRAMYNALRENIIHQKAILRLADLVLPYLASSGFVVVFGYSVLMAVESLIFLDDPKENMPVLFIVLLDVVAVFVMMYAGQMVQDKSLETSIALYSTPWSVCGKEYRSLLRIAIVRSQKPIVVQTRFLSVEAGLMTFADIISWGYKMLNLIWSPVA